MFTIPDSRDIVSKYHKRTADRGLVQQIILKKPIVLNSNTITKATIEIDHINYGLNKKTGTLNKKKRTDFSINDIENFLALLDGDYIFPVRHRKRISRFQVRIDCPVNNKFYGKQFIMIFETNYDKSEEIYTITLFPGWQL